ncbi:hypothetical protein CKO51_13310 [Rhodopirellula sp. SM50]|nr:hypothetical protein CKO51_13310 [Rhodopirellula sp. SM50]
MRVVAQASVSGESETSLAMGGLIPTNTTCSICFVLAVESPADTEQGIQLPDALFTAGQITERQRHPVSSIEKLPVAARRFTSGGILW